MDIPLGSPSALGHDPSHYGREPLRVLLFMTVPIVWLVGACQQRVRWSRGQYAFEDGFMAAAVMLYFANAAVALYGSYHSLLDPIKDLETAMFSLIVCEGGYALLSVTIRYAIALFLWRKVTTDFHRYCIYYFMAWAWVVSLLYVLYITFTFDSEQASQPPENAWLDSLPVQGLMVVFAMLDIWLLALAQRISWTLGLSKRSSKMVDVLVFMGIIAAIVLITRNAYLWYIPVSQNDVLDRISGGQIWEVLETTLGIIAGCAATLIRTGNDNGRRELEQNSPVSAPRGGSRSSRRAAGGWRLSQFKSWLRPHPRART
ncbi:hypothetical protein QBC46DRAFT_445190 [Diplogelasinospora grovesii]|uniref:Rhodopsin domain-containing protein n=1 Tax=Diplogelasinospora grovesii TaxID=303347 RepID=A0AAN6S8S2_9PEZI|nr:hypothetical protein QBC46DRAFT_445190 [Diplogelasinospora grovesii]